MILWTRRAVALATVTVSLVSSPPPSSSLVPQSSSNASSATTAALILGGFLLPASAYQPWEESLTSRLGSSVSTLAYNDPILQEDSLSGGGSQRIPCQVLDSKTRPDILIGHSKGARTIARWMPYWTSEVSVASPPSRPQQGQPKISAPICILVEPVDVVPPGAPSYSLLEEDWKTPQHLETLSKTPTLIIAAPYTDTSRRYGKATNLCAPPGKDAWAFYQVASEARHGVQDAAPLSYVELSGLGHNDVIIASDRATAIGGCANGPDRAKGAQIVTDCIIDWLQLLDSKSIKG